MTIKALLNTIHAAATIGSDGVGLLTFQNSGKLNLLNSPAMSDILHALNVLQDQESIKVLIFRAEGERAFIGGADLRELVTLTEATARGFITRLREVCDAIYTFPVPVIARLAGWCIGGGLEVALSCDLRIADSSARFGMPEVAVGIPSVIHAALLPRLIGSSMASWLLLTGESIDATIAMRCGLVHELVDPGALDERVSARAAQLASIGPAVLRQQKRLLREWQSQSLAESINHSIDEFVAAYTTG